ncbi:hypothetical protein CNECB9_50010 [Cupriavidus necator]|uniref:Uncharacterized protein n=1 Tax=Cupriavidus necator TaxID=106590 RepID=A0A1K0J025_CUPNE|nr:hypothetical protein CNECB9_50010 [Cupriavidus necator]
MMSMRTFMSVRSAAAERVPQRIGWRLGREHICRQALPISHADKLPTFSQRITKTYSRYAIGNICSDHVTNKPNGELPCQSFL